MRYASLIALTTAAFLAGCANETSNTPAAGESESSVAAIAADDVIVEESANQLSDVQTDQDKPAVPEFGEWLSLPAGLSNRVSQAYPDIVSSALAGDAEGLAYLASISQQIAGELMRKGDDLVGYKFQAQAGKALRASLAGGFLEAPPSFTGPIFYDEASALAVEGKTEAAAAALADAVQNGFSDMESLASDEVLAAVRSMDGFDAKLADWMRIAEEKTKAHAREELAAGETFPFSFALMDIEGNEQSLEALKGKVVIVDVWGTWCPPCRAEVPSFIKLQDKYGEQGFQMVGLNYERTGSDEKDLAAVVEYVADNGVNYPCIMGDDATKEMIPDFQGFPTTLFIDKTGTVRMKAVGLHDYGYLDAIVAELLAE